MSTDPLSLVLKTVEVYLKFSEQNTSHLVGERLASISSDLAVIVAKEDQSIVREIVSSFEAIKDALSTPRRQTRENYLNFAEQALLKNTALDRSLSTRGFKNSHWVALSFYGLAIICALRKDDQIAARHILRMYKEDPRNARSKYFPEFFSSLFRKDCQDLYELHDYAEILPGISQKAQEQIRKYGRSFTDEGVDKVLDFLCNRFPRVDKSNIEEYRSGYAVMCYTGYPLSETRERNLDKRCIELANKHLEKL